MKTITFLSTLRAYHCRILWSESLCPMENISASTSISVPAGVLLSRIVSSLLAFIFDYLQISFPMIASSRGYSWRTFCCTGSSSRLLIWHVACTTLPPNYHVTTSEYPIILQSLVQYIIGSGDYFLVIVHIFWLEMNALISNWRIEYHMIQHTNSSRVSVSW